jgi:hypothetical protein
MWSKYRNPLSNCILCGSTTVTFKSHALVAPWIELLINSLSVLQTSLLHCSDCDLDFFSYRYSDLEMNALYSGYRGEKYFSFRRRFEPWFTQRSLNYWDPVKNPSAV